MALQNVYLGRNPPLTNKTENIHKMKLFQKTPEYKRKIILLVGDFLILIITTILTIAVYNFAKDRDISRLLTRPLKTYSFYLSISTFLLLSYIFEMYELKKNQNKIMIILVISFVAIMSFCVVFGFAKVLQLNKTTVIYTGFFYALSIGPLYYWRTIFRRVMVRSRKFIKNKIYFVGTDLITEEILKHMKRKDYTVLGLITVNRDDSCNNNLRLNVAGNCRQLNELSETNNANVIVTAMNQYLSLSTVKEIYKLKLSGVAVYDSAHFYELLTDRIPIEHYLKSDKIPYFNLNVFASFTFKNTKRLFDIIASSIGLILLAPIIVIISIIIRLTSKGPVFFRQQRLGFYEKPFDIIKFRTMVANAEKETGPQWSEKNDPRTTKVGKFLRNARLDELPQLINVLKGDMSFVGPRPIRRHFADVIEEQMPFYTLRFSIKPGLTGWAQVNYHYGGTVEGHIEKCQYDLYYIKHASFFLDIFIILKTIQTVFRRSAH